MKNKPEEINKRLFDLVRYSRAELHEQDLITDEEYSWLLADCELNKGGGSPSPRRLEDYDSIKLREKQMIEDFKSVLFAIESDENQIGILTSGVVKGFKKKYFKS